MPEAFRPLFRRWSRRVRAGLALRHALTGTAVGLVVGAAVAGALWETRHGALRPVGAAAGLFGAAAGLAFARRKRWSDGHVALYLDARLRAHEAIATAIELEPRDGESDAGKVVTAEAVVALGRATPGAVRPPILRRAHVALPLGAAAIAWISLAPLPPVPTAMAAPPGADKVQLAQVAGLEKVITLAELGARDEPQRERLKKLSEDAKKLRDRIRDGVEKREAQAEIAKLKDGIVAERLSLGDGEQRQGMESALGKLGENPDLKNAQKALGDRDLVRLDEEMERLANRLEKGDRERAQKTLEEAAEAARKAGAPDVAKALEAEKKRLAQAGRDGDRLRELAKDLGDALGPDGTKALEELDHSGGAKEERELAKRLDAALGKLTPEERKKLAESLKRRMKDATDDGAHGMSKRELGEMLDQLDERKLEEALRRMAEEGEGSTEEGDRQKGLDDAEDGAGEAEQELGGVPMPVQGDGPGKGSPKPGKGGKDDGTPTAGHTEGGGPGDHKGVTGVIEGDGLRARATGRMNKGRPMPGVVMGRTTGKAGETANVQGIGALGAAAAGEVGGVERSDVPEEYREQVGRYFQPK